MARVVIRSARSASPDLSTISRGLRLAAKEDSLSRPRFSGYWVKLDVPPGSREIQSYELQGATIRLLSLPGKLEFMYHLVPWEYTLDSNQIKILNKTIERLARIPPKDISIPLEDLKSHVSKTSSSIIRSLLNSELDSRKRSVEENERLINQLSQVIARHTVGFGILEILLADRRIEDVYIDAPSERNQINITIGGVNDENAVGKCVTNITVSSEEVEAFSSRLRQYSGRAFSEAHPVLETDIESLDARATVIGPPLSPHGTALAVRRHAVTPWTLLRLVKNGTLDCYSAALISFLIDGRSTALVCGARGSGKSSLLSAMMFEFPLSQRIITIEDTLELPVKQMQSMGYKVQSVLIEQRMGESRERETEEALRVSLRLGESAIVVGEVRGREAQTLYESMRTGRAGSSVLGTIHGDSAQSVHDRVVYDLGIPEGAFAATDVILTMGLYRPGGSQRQVRRVMEIAEFMDKEPCSFRTLVGFDHSTGKLTNHLLDGSNLISRIARSWNISYEDALLNIEARASIRELLLEATQLAGSELLSPSWVGAANEFFWRHLEKGESYETIVIEFKKWLDRRTGYGGE